MDDERESIQDPSSPEEEEEEEEEEEMEEGEVVEWRRRDRLQTLIRLEHNYSFSM